MFIKVYKKVFSAFLKKSWPKSAIVSYYFIKEVILWKGEYMVMQGLAVRNRM